MKKHRILVNFRGYTGGSWYLTRMVSGEYRLTADRESAHEFALTSDALKALADLSYIEGIKSERVGATRQGGSWSFLHKVISYEEVA